MARIRASADPPPPRQALELSFRESKDPFASDQQARSIPGHVSKRGARAEP